MGIFDYIINIFNKPRVFWTATEEFALAVFLICCFIILFVLFCIIVKIVSKIRWRIGYKKYNKCTKPFGRCGFNNIERCCGCKEYKEKK